ncbi:MAG: DUF3883 domain-containing protein [Butyrivibrio sp.]|nr:DUF3883 domain-containing protein [Butyrivibrio sp.]
MADYKWRSEEEKFEAIGFLAIPNVIAAIQPTVPRDGKKKFEEEYRGMYSEGYPYTADKYGNQFRIYLNDIEGAPDSILEQIDDAYGNRINNTAFIKELVKEYGFRFTKEPQDSEGITNLVFKKVGRPLYDSFQKGFFTNRDFIKDIDGYLKKGQKFASPNMLEYAEQSIGKRQEKSASRSEKAGRAMTKNQMLMLGWNGEAYIAHLLETHDSSFLQAIGLSKDVNYSYDWFNSGFQDADEEVNHLDDNLMGFEFVKKWEDRSVGEGCDIRVELGTGERLEIEVKTSRSTYPFFAMTSIEMQQMERDKEKYFLVKINNFDKLLKEQSPDIIVIRNPYDKLFHPKHMKEATFIIGGK